MAASTDNYAFFTTMFILIAIATACGCVDEECVYTLYIRTGSIWMGGTDSKISLALYDAAGFSVRFKEIEAWGGLMGSDYDYFERGNLDIFTGRGPCLTKPVCKMNLTSDGSGKNHGWYTNYVEVTTTGPRHIPCAQQKFTVEQWLATNTYPYELTAIRNYCGNSSTHDRAGGDVIESNSSSVLHMPKYMI